MAANLLLSFTRAGDLLTTNISYTDAYGVSHATTASVVVPDSNPPAVFPPSGTLTASPQAIVSGQSTKLTWTSSNATSSKSLTFVGAGAAAGSVTVKPTATTTYLITFTGSGGTTSVSCTVNVSPAPTTSLTSFPQTITVGQTSSVLSWTSTNALGTTGTNFSTGNALSGSLTVSPLNNTTYSITANGANGSTAQASASVTVNIPVTPPTGSLSVLPAIITAGQTALLSWSSTNATSSTGTGFLTGGTTSGSLTISPTTNTAYSVTFSGPGGTATASASLTVNPLPPPSPTVTLTATPTSITAGQTTILAWSSTNATSTTGTGFSTGGATSGSITLTLNANATYSISATGAGGTVVATASVTVTPVNTTPCSNVQLTEGKLTPVMVAATKPARGVLFSDKNFGTCITRATDHAVDGLNNFARNDYSRRQAYNADNSLYLIYANDGSWYTYSSATYTKVKVLPPLAGDAEPQWHPTDPSLLYYIPLNGGMQVFLLNVNTLTQTTAADFTGKTPFTNAARIWTKSEGSPSKDGRYWGFQVEDTNFNILGFITWDMLNNKLIASMPANSFGRPDHCSMSANGRWFVISWDAPNGTWAYSLDFATKKQVHQGGEHSDLAIGADGHDYYVSIDYQSNAGDVYMFDMDTGIRTVLFPTYLNGSASSFHFSGKGFNKPGWMVGAAFGNSGGDPWFKEKVFVFQMAANPKIYELAFHHCIVAGQYFAEIHPSVNRDFTLINFNSNWDQSGSLDVDTYQIKIPNLPNSTVLLPITTLTATPNSITAGQTITLAWTSTNATSTTGTGFSTAGTTSGSVTLSPATTSTYSITATGVGGSASATTTVTVNIAPPPGQYKWGGVSFPWQIFDGSIPDVPVSTTGNTYYCDPVNGKDTNDGTSFTFVSGTKGPKKTIYGAVLIPTLKAGDTVLLGGGIYREYPSFNNGPSGKLGLPITFGSYGRGTGAPIWDGGVKPNTWTKYTAQGQTTVWQCSTAGTVITPAKTPMLGIYVNNGVNEFALKEVSHGQLSLFAGDTYPVNQTQTSVTDNTNRWYYDGAANMVYADFGGTLGTQNPNNFDISLLYDTYNSGAGHYLMMYLDNSHNYFSFIGLTMRCGSWSAVFTEASGLTFDHCDIKFNGGTAILFGQSGAKLATDNKLLYSRLWMNVLNNWPRFNNGNNGGGWPAAISWTSQSNGLALGNISYMNGGEGLTFNDTDVNGLSSTNNVARHNIVYDNFSINLYVNNTQNVLFEQNYIFQHPLDESQTFDGLFAQAPSYAGDFGKRLVPPNFSIADEPESAYDSAAHTSNIVAINNIFVGGHRGLIDYDDGTVGIHHGLRNCLIANNTFVLSSTPDVTGQTSYCWEHGFSGAGDTSINSFLQNNIMLTTSASDLFFLAPTINGVTTDYNIYSGPGQWNDAGTVRNFAGWKTAHPSLDQHSVNANANLVDVTAFDKSVTISPVYDWRNAVPKTGSFVTGTTQSAFTTDFTGTNRNGVYVIGAVTGS